MECVIKHFNELRTEELYAIIKARVNVLWWNKTVLIRSWMIRIRMPGMSG